jgi:hypothetical protein
VWLTLQPELEIVDNAGNRRIVMILPVKRVAITQILLKMIPTMAKQTLCDAISTLCVFDKTIIVFNV